MNARALAATLFSAILLTDGPAETAKELPASVVPRFLGAAKGTAADTVVWRNGEQLKCALSGMENERLIFKTSLFTQAMRLRQEVIERFDFGETKSSSEGEFALILANGSRFTGTLTGLDESSLTFKTSSGGEFLVKREQVVGLERLKGAGLLAQGMDLLKASSSAEEAQRRNGNEVSQPQLAAAGLVAFVSFGAQGNAAINLPGKVLVEMILKSDASPRFRLSLADDQRYLKLESWGDELVLFDGQSFASAGVLFDEKAREANVRLSWDQATGQATVHGPDGKVFLELKSAPPPAKKVESKPATLKGLMRLFRRMGDLTLSDPSEAVPSSTKPPKGVTLENAGDVAILERFRVVEWSGQAPGAFSAKDAFAETSSETISGEAIGKEGDDLVMRAKDGATRKVALSSLRGVWWAREANRDPAPDLTAIWFANGDLVRGKLTSIQDKRAKFEADFAKEALAVPLQGARTMILPSIGQPGPGKALDELDLIRGGDLSLHGTLVATGQKLPSFQPVGSDEPLSPVEKADLSISRYLPENANLERAPALLHVRGKETIPSNLPSIAEDKLSFVSPLGEKGELPVSELSAVQLTMPKISRGGFGDWQIASKKDGSVTRQGETIVLQADGAIGHPYLTQGGDFRFSMKSNSGQGMACLRVRLFCSGLLADSDSTNFLIADYGGGNMYFGEEGEAGQFHNQNNVMRGDKPAEVRVSFEGDKINFSVNDKSLDGARRVGRNEPKQKGTKKSGAGVLLESASVWGNTPGSIELSDFKSLSLSRVPSAPPFSEAGKRDALLLPRLRRDAPPRQVLIGLNGDLLRGEIETMTSSQFLLRVGLETLKVPTNRVAAAVWVLPPDKTESKIEPPKEGKPVEQKTKTTDDRQWLDLADGGRLGLRDVIWKADGVIAQHAILGKVSIPAKLVHQVSLKEPAPLGALAALSGWKFENTKDPVPPGSDEANASPLLGKPAEDFKLDMIEGEAFALSKSKGKVVVLDFWATWCAPCVRSLPPLAEALAAFPAEKLDFIAVNQAETKEQVKRFMQIRELKLRVGLDVDNAVAKKYGVEGIPHTVVVDREGKIAYTSTGAVPGGEQKIAEAVKKALEGSGATE